MNLTLESLQVFVVLSLHHACLSLHVLVKRVFVELLQEIALVVADIPLWPLRLVIAPLIRVNREALLIDGDLFYSCLIMDLEKILSEVVVLSLDIGLNGMSLRVNYLRIRLEF